MLNKIISTLFALALSVHAYAEEKKETECSGVKSLLCAKSNETVTKTALGTAGGTAGLTFEFSQDYLKAKNAQGLPSNSTYIPSNGSPSNARQAIGYFNEGDQVTMIVREAGVEKPIMVAAKDADYLLQEFEMNNIKVLKLRTVRDTSKDAATLRRLGRRVKIGSAIVVVAAGVAGLEIYKESQERRARRNEATIQVETYQQSRTGAAAH